MSTPARRKATTRVSEAIARPARTGPQAIVAFAIIEFIDSFMMDLTEKQYGAAVGLLVLILAGVQVLVEDGIGKALMRSVPSVSVPVADDAAKSSGPGEHEDDPEDFVGELVTPDHDLDIHQFVEVDEDDKDDEENAR